MAFVGAFLLHELGDSSSAQDNVEGSGRRAADRRWGAMVEARYYPDRRSGQNRIGVISDTSGPPAADHRDRRSAG
jgi:hypothetical protein